MFECKQTQTKPTTVCHKKNTVPLLGGGHHKVKGTKIPHTPSSGTRWMRPVLPTTTDYHSCESHTYCSRVLLHGNPSILRASLDKTLIAFSTRRHEPCSAGLLRPKNHAPNVNPHHCHPEPRAKRASLIGVATCVVPFSSSTKTGATARCVRPLRAGRALLAAAHPFQHTMQLSHRQALQLFLRLPREGLKLGVASRGSSDSYGAAPCSSRRTLDSARSVRTQLAALAVLHLPGVILTVTWTFSFHSASWISCSSSPSFPFSSSRRIPSIAGFKLIPLVRVVHRLIHAPLIVAALLVTHLQLATHQQHAHARPFSMKKTINSQNLRRTRMAMMFTAESGKEHLQNCLPHYLQDKNHNRQQGQ